MLVFIIPLKSPEVAKSWELVSKLFERTIYSIFQQTLDDFRVIVVCNRRPNITFEDSRLTYIEVDFPVPDDNRKAKKTDKRIKIRVGLFYSKEYNPSHTMVVNADDCINKEIVAFVNQNSQHNGWFFNKGYFYDEKTGLLYVERQNFYKWCGTSNIIKYGLFEIPATPDYEFLCQRQNLVKTYYYSHRRAAQELMAINENYRLSPLPFPGAVYTIEHGENNGIITGDMLFHTNPLSHIKQKLFNKRQITPNIRETFGVYDLDDSI